MKKLVNLLINKKTNGVDVYYNNGSMWLIFTDEKKWVIELTKDGTLWYNYYFFEKIFKYLSLDVVKNQHYITEWVEDVIKNGVSSTTRHNMLNVREVEDVIKNGVSSTSMWQEDSAFMVEDTIKNGVKKTYKHPYRTNIMVEDTIENGIKETKHTHTHPNYIEDTIQNGIKETQKEYHNKLKYVEKIIENGVKQTYVDGYISDFWVEKDVLNKMLETREISRDIKTVEGVIENGVRETLGIHNGVRHIQQNVRVNNTIKNGIKEVKTDDNYRNHFRQINKSEKVIENGIKITKQEPSQRTWKVDNVIKETRTPNEHDFQATMDWLDHNNTTSVPFLINNIINTGIKKTEGGIHFYEDTTDNVIKNGIKQTQPHVLQILNPMTFEPVFKEEKRMDEVNNVLEKGIKNHK